jgi:hypothetical protein
MRIWAPILLGFLVLWFVLAEASGADSDGSLRSTIIAMAIGIAGVFFVFIPLVIYLASQRIWQRAAEVRAPRNYVFSETGIELISEIFRSHFSWDLIVTARKSRGQIFLGTAQRQFFLIPVNAFEGTDDLARFSALVRHKVNNSKI